MATRGMRPLTEAELAQPGPGLARASAYHTAGVVRWMTRVSPAGCRFRRAGPPAPRRSKRSRRPAVAR